jgi:hypothetical protein
MQIVQGDGASCFCFVSGKGGRQMVICCFHFRFCQFHLWCQSDCKEHCNHVDQQRGKLVTVSGTDPGETCYHLREWCLALPGSRRSISTDIYYVELTFSWCFCFLGPGQEGATSNSLILACSSTLLTPQMPGKHLVQIIIGLCWWRQIVFQNEQQQMFHCLQRWSRCRKQRKLPNRGLVQGSKFESHHGENNTLSTCNGDFAKGVCLYGKHQCPCAQKGKDACM